MLYSLVGILVVILDQAVKFWVQNSIFGQDVVKFIPGVLSLVNVHNSGAAFGILSGSNARIYFIVVTGVFALLVVFALATNFVSGRLARWSLVMVTAGGLANMIDRIMYGYVQDMFKVELFNFAIFNVADVFITVFAVLFALAMIFEKPEDDIIEELYQDDEEEDEDYDEDNPPRKSLVAKMKEKREASRSASKKARQEKYEREYEEYRAQQLEAMHMNDLSASNARRAQAERSSEDSQRQMRRAREEQPQRQMRRPQEGQPVQRREQPVQRRSAPQNEDPFAAWEQATAKHDSQRAANYAESAMGTGVRANVPAQRRVVQQEVQPTASRPMPRAERPAQPVQPAKPKPAAPEEEFSLDDILAEFK